MIQSQQLRTELHSYEFMCYLIVFLRQVDHLLTLLVITLIGLPVSKVTIDELALDLQSHGEETHRKKTRCKKKI
jgi:hypothetical protein